jgi:phosphoribosylformylglycinamidine synthase I
MLWGVIQFPGSCDERDALHACSLAGEARLIWHEERDLGVDAVVIPGGFSYGDYLRAGAIARFSPAMEAVAGFAAAGGPVLGICNGFQVLCEAGLLPGALLRNEQLRFVCRQVDLVAGGAASDHLSTEERAEATARSPFLAGIEPGERLSIPVKHGEGRYFAPAEMLDAIEANGQVAFRYAPGQNPNGSARDIAGVVNEAGNVLGLMPHPEHAVDPLTGSSDGLRLFAAASSAFANA